MRARRIVVAALLLAPVYLGAQSVSAAQADSAFQKGDWRVVAQGYAPITQSDATNGQAWFRLGVARHALGELDAAVAAYEKARDLKFQVVAAEFRMARVYSLKHDADRSVQALDRAITAGFANPQQAMADADLAWVRNDAKFKSAIARLDAIRYPCRAGKEQAQLDYWIGHWDVFAWNPNGPNGRALLGTNDVEPILDHCVLLENWSGAPGGKGKSFNFYDTNLGKWRQVWVADGGGSLDYTGEFKDGAMRFAGWTLGPNGQRVLQKLTFFPIAPDTVRQLFETSNDSGKTWQPGFDGKYVRRKG